MTLFPLTRIRVEKTMRTTTEAGEFTTTTEVTAVLEVEKPMLPTDARLLRKELRQEVAMDVAPQISSTGGSMFTNAEDEE